MIAERAAWKGRAARLLRRVRGAAVADRRGRRPAPAGARMASGGGAARRAGAGSAPGAEPRRRTAPANGGARSGTSRGRPAVGIRRLRVPVPRLRGRIPPRARLAIVVLVLLVAALAGGWLWLRDSALVSVQEVTVTGADGTDAVQVRGALSDAARHMTTLDVSVARLRAAVRSYPVIGDLRVSAHFPHKLQIRVIERVPVGTVTVGAKAMPVSQDGTLLRDVSVSSSLPMLDARLGAGATQVIDGHGGQEVALLAAAPPVLLGRLSQVLSDPTHGLSAQVRGGPSLYFGDGSELRLKWIAASEVLADAGSQGASYIDVTDPQRPAAGTGSDSTGGSASAAGTAGAAASTTTTGPTAAPTASTTTGGG